jgi:hypothetical protein
LMCQPEGRPLVAKNKSNDRKRNPPGKSGNGHARVRPTAEAIADAKREDLFFHHLKKIKPLLVTEAAAKGAVTKAYETAKKEGITKKEIQLAIAYESEEGEQKVAADIERMVRIARWVGTDLGEQMEMFGGKAADPIFDDGKHAALRGEKCKAPAHHGQKAAQRWNDGWHAGNTARNAAIQEGMGDLGTAAKAVVENAAAAAGMHQDAPPALHG